VLIVHGVKLCDTVWNGITSRCSVCGWTSIAARACSASQHTSSVEVGCPVPGATTDAHSHSLHALSTVYVLVLTRTRASVQTRARCAAAALQWVCFSSPIPSKLRNGSTSLTWQQGCMYGLQPLPRPQPHCTALQLRAIRFGGMPVYSWLSSPVLDSPENFVIVGVNSRRVQQCCNKCACFTSAQGGPGQATWVLQSLVTFALHAMSV
jgi:hypothetical protein